MAELLTLSDTLLCFLLFLEFAFGFVEVHVGMVFKLLLEVTGHQLYMGDINIYCCPIKYSLSKFR